MKKRITVEQLNKLSRRGRKKYQEWCEKHIGRAVDEYNKIDIDLFKDKNGLIPFGMLPLLSIGQLIEFLDENDDFEFKNYYKWTDYLLLDDGINGAVFHDPREWCNKLWKPVKEILEK